MNTIPLRELRLSAALDAADPAAISRLGAGCAHNAQELQAQASALEALAARMRGGAWVSPAGEGFAATAVDRAQRVRVAAGLTQQLAQALAGLSAQLAEARLDAQAAVAEGHQLDREAEALNARVAVAPAITGHHPEAVLMSDPHVTDLVSRMDLAAFRLADAERRARAAWDRALAGFDVAGYGTPQLRERMATAQWDPAANVRLAPPAVLPNACGAMDELALPRDGVLTGPDGRDYQLVVQTTRAADGRLLISTEDDPDQGRDQPDGWRQLAVRYGTTAYGPKAGLWEKVAVALGGVAGMSYPEGSTFAPSLLGSLHLMPGGGAYVPEVPSVAQADPVKEAPAAPPRGKEPSRYWVAPSAGLASGRRATVPDGIGLIDSGISGFLLAGHLDDARAAAYRVVFEENGAGERRARMQTFRVITGPGGPPMTVAAGAYVDEHGKLAGRPVTGEPVLKHPIMRGVGN